MSGPDKLTAAISGIEHAGLEDLRHLWVHHYGAAPALRSVALLRMVLAWRLQAEQHGRLDPETRRALARKGPVRAERLDLSVPG